MYSTRNLNFDANLFLPATTRSHRGEINISLSKMFVAVLKIYRLEFIVFSTIDMWSINLLKCIVNRQSTSLFRVYCSDNI